MNVNRIPISSCSKVRSEENIAGNFTSVEGEYFIPSANRTGFYKLNSSFSNNPDLRELLASIILKAIDVPVADIIPVYDEERKDNGCISMNILNQGERFLEDDPLTYVQFSEHLKELQGLDRFIEYDLYRCSTQFNFSPELLEERRKFLIEYVFISAFLGNDDIKTDNCQLIYNENNGTIRNPEYYDMGMSFIDPTTASENDRIRYFFTNQLDIDVLQELYEKYPKEIEEISKKIEKYLNKKSIKAILDNEIFQDFGQETVKKIWLHMGKKISYISKQNERLYNISHHKDCFLTSLDEIKEATKGTDISWIDKAKVFLQSIKQKILRERE